MHTVVSVKKPFPISAPPRSRLLPLLGLGGLDPVRPLGLGPDAGQIALVAPVASGGPGLGRNDASAAAAAPRLDVAREGLGFLDAHVGIGDERDELVGRVAGGEPRPSPVIRQPDLMNDA